MSQASLTFMLCFEAQSLQKVSFICLCAQWHPGVSDKCTTDLSSDTAYNLTAGVQVCAQEVLGSPLANGP